MHLSDFDGETEFSRFKDFSGANSAFGTQTFYEHKVKSPLKDQKMVKCPRCRKESAELKSKTENDYFSVKYYSCGNCMHIFKVARVKYPTDQ